MVYSSLSTSGLKQNERQLFKSESENETQGSWKHFRKNLRQHQIKDTTPFQHKQNIVVIDSYEPIDLSKRRACAPSYVNEHIKDKPISFTNTRNVQRLVSTPECIIREKSPDQSDLNDPLEQAPTTKSIDEEDGDEYFNLEEDEDISRDSRILEKKLQEMNICDGQAQDLVRERQEFEETYKNLNSLSTTKKEDEERREDTSADREEYFQEFLQQTHASQSDKNDKREEDDG